MWVVCRVPHDGRPQRGPPERIYQWNVSLQRELARNMVVQASYVGNRGYWESTGSLQDFDAISPAILAKYGFTIGNLDDATVLNTRISLLNANQPPDAPRPWRSRCSLMTASRPLSDCIAGHQALPAIQRGHRPECTAGKVLV